MPDGAALIRPTPNCVKCAFLTYA